MTKYLPCIYLALALVLSGCSGASEPTDPPTLAKCYAAEFGQSPLAGITNLQARQVVVGDAGAAWLRFEANSNIVTQLVSSRFAPSERAKFIEESIGGNIPRWWRPEEDELTDFYICNQWRSDTNHYSVAVLAHDIRQHVIYFHHAISF